MPWNDGSAMTMKSSCITMEVSAISNPGLEAEIETAGGNAKLVLRDFAKMSPPHRTLIESEAGRRIEVESLFHRPGTSTRIRPLTTGRSKTDSVDRDS